MKLTLACSCLEPGMDGVGDYTRRLADELRAQGHKCNLLALSDAYVNELTEQEIEIPGGTYWVLRLAAREIWTTRIKQARDFLEEFPPDWISWQIVPYGFDPRGLSFGLGEHLSEISLDFRTEVMFHEIWIGEAAGSSLKRKLVGRMQRRILNGIFQQLRPRVIHTHTPLYAHLLGKLGRTIKILPLFGNVPIADHADTEWLRKKWAGRDESFLANRGDVWIFTMFGSIHPEWDEMDFRERAAEAARKVGKKCLLIAIGRPGGAGEQKLRRLEQNQDETWQILNLGQQPEAEISQCLLTADFGVASVPPENVFKSGTFAAMVEHGLPVVVTRPMARYKNCPSELLTTGMRNVVTDFELTGLEKTKVESQLPSVASQLIDDLKVARSRMQKEA